MRKLSVVLFFMTLISCNNSSGEKSAGQQTSDTAAAPGNTADSKEQKGLDLVAKNGCFTCHQVAAVSTGPSYSDVAARYPNNQAVVDSLSEKIIKGGSGNWGTVPMIPHPAVSPEDAKAMVEYVLSLKK